MIHALLALVLVAQDAPAPAAGAAAPPAAAAAPAKAKPDANDPNAVVCKREPILGSRLEFTRTCKTRAEWDQETQFTQHNVERMQHPGGMPNHG